MICTICGRPVKKIIGDMVNESKATQKTELEVLYKDTDSRLVCGRCVNVNSIVRVCGGEPVLTFNPKLKRFRINKTAVDTAIKTRVIIEEDKIFAMS